MPRFQEAPGFFNKRKKMSKADKALKIARSLQKNIDTNKYVDVLTVNAVTTSWSVNYISGTAVGDDVNNRDGREIFTRKISMIGGMTTVVAATLPQRIRVILLYDTMCDGAIPASTEIFDTATIDAFPVRDTEYPQRFKWIFDRIYVVNPTTGGAGAVSPRFTKRIKKKISYIGTGATSTSAGKNAFFLCVIADNVTGGAAGYSLNTRIMYTD